MKYKIYSIFIFLSAFAWLWEGTYICYKLEWVGYDMWQTFPSLLTVVGISCMLIALAIYLITEKDIK